MTKRIQVNPSGIYTFCVSLGAAAGAGARCVTGATAVANTWAYVMGVYDSVNKQIRISVNGGAGAESIATQPDPLPTAQGSVSIGNAIQPNNSFIGQLIRPTLMPGVPSDSQRTTLRAQLGSAPGLSSIPGGSPADLLKMPLVQFPWAAGVYAPKADGTESAVHVLYSPDYVGLGQPGSVVVPWVPGAHACKIGTNPEIYLYNPDWTEAHWATPAEWAAAGAHPIGVCP